MKVDVLTVTALLGAVTALGVAAPAPPPGFDVYHFDSIARDHEFEEVFLVHGVVGTWATAEVEVLRDGQPLVVAWQDEDGRVTVGDSFSFVQEAFDTKHVLTAEVAGKEVMRCRFGGGAGLPIHPDTWRAMGHPEQVRCLQLTDDQ